MNINEKHKKILSLSCVTNHLFDPSILLGVLVALYHIGILRSLTQNQVVHKFHVNNVFFLRIAVFCGAFFDEYRFESELNEQTIPTVLFNS